MTNYQVALKHSLFIIEAKPISYQTEPISLVETKPISC